MTNYALAGDDVLKRVGSLVTKHHGDLLDAKAEVDVILAFAARDKKHNKPRGQALKRNGQPVHGLTRVVPPKDQVKGAKAIELVLDGDRWAKLTRAQGDALLDHLLTRVEVEFGKSEDAEHKLKIRRFDRVFEWYDEVAQRHGDASIEIQQAKSFVETGAASIYFRQLDLGLEGDGAKPQDAPFDKWKVSKLRRLARERNISIPPAAKKIDIIKALEGATSN